MIHSKLIRPPYAIVAVFAAIIYLQAETNAIQADELLFETANGDQQTTGTLFGDDFYLFHRFEVTSATELQTVGGYFQNFSGEVETIFAAVVALSGPSDYPNSIDLSTSDLLDTTLIDVPDTGFNGQDASGPLSLALGVGWYALVFGTDAFGAPPGPEFEIAMPNLSNDLAPTQYPVSLFQPDHPTIPNQIIIQVAEPRFFATVVPEPSTYALASIAAVLFGCICWRTARGRRQKACASLAH